MDVVMGRPIRKLKGQRHTEQSPSLDRTPNQEGLNSSTAGPIVPTSTDLRTQHNYMPAQTSSLRNALSAQEQPTTGYPSMPHCSPTPQLSSGPQIPDALRHYDGDSEATLFNVAKYPNLCGEDFKYNGKFGSAAGIPSTTRKDKRKGKENAHVYDDEECFGSDIVPDAAEQDARAQQDQMDNDLDPDAPDPHALEPSRQVSNNSRSGLIPGLDQGLLDMKPVPGMFPEPSLHSVMTPQERRNVYPWVYMRN